MRKKNVACAIQDKITAALVDIAFFISLEPFAFSPQAQIANQS